MRVLLAVLFCFVFGRIGWQAGWVAGWLTGWPNKEYPRNLLEYFPLISNKDVVMEPEGIDPRSSKSIFH